jgi:hypothetical protein
MKTLEERFWDNVGPIDKNGCWAWKGSKFRFGYGKMNHKNKAIAAHRVSWLIHNGGIPDNLCVLHSCDNPPCTNPKHLFLGSHADNAADRNKKGRQARGDRQGSRLHPESLLRGSRHQNSKLTEQVVIRIRKERKGGETQQSLANKYRVSRSTISQIVRRKTWTHV